MRDIAAGIVHWAGLLFAVTVLLACGYAYIPVAQAWREAWAIQQGVLASAASFAACLENGDAVIHNAPMDHKGIEVFGAPWDIGPAILATYPGTAEDIQMAPNYAWPMKFEPGSFTIANGWAWRGKQGAKRLWIWNAITGRARLIMEAAEFPPQERDALFASAVDLPDCRRPGAPHSN